MNHERVLQHSAYRGCVTVTAAGWQRSAKRFHPQCAVAHAHTLTHNYCTRQCRDTVQRVYCSIQMLCAGGGSGASCNRLQCVCVTAAELGLRANSARFAVFALSLLHWISARLLICTLYALLSSSSQEKEMYKLNLVHRVVQSSTITAAQKPSKSHLVH